MNAASNTKLSTVGSGTGFTVTAGYVRPDAKVMDAPGVNNSIVKKLVFSASTRASAVP